MATSGAGSSVEPSPATLVTPALSTWDHQKHSLAMKAAAAVGDSDALMRHLAAGHQQPCEHNAREGALEAALGQQPFTDDHARCCQLLFAWPGLRTCSPKFMFKSWGTTFTTLQC